LTYNHEFTQQWCTAIGYPLSTDWPKDYPKSIKNIRKIVIGQIPTFYIKSIPYGTVLLNMRSVYEECEKNHVSEMWN